MSWKLQIVPKGLLLSKYLKNVILVNTDNVDGIARSQVLSDDYQTFNQDSNTVDIKFQINIFNNDPRNTQPAPDVVTLNYVSITNNPDLTDVAYITFNQFSSPYNLNTDYVVDLNTNNIENTNLPSLQSLTFTEVSGSGNFILKNWPLSGSSGIKKVFLNVNAGLSDGTNVTYPDNLQTYDEIVVCSSYASSPGKPQAIGLTPDNYVGTPLYYKADVASNSGLIDTNDRGIAVYFWDGLILNSTANYCKNNYSQANLQLFSETNPVSSQFNQEKFPVVFSQSSALPTWSVASYKSYRASTAFQLSTTNNIYFSEYYLNNDDDTYNYVSGKSFFYEFNITNSTGSTKYLRQQLVFDLTFKTVDIYTSVDNTTWSTDTTYVPTALYNLQTITDPDVVAQLTQAGSFLNLLEVVDATNKIFQNKLVFKPANSNANYVLNETLFTSSSLTTSLNIFSEFRMFIQNAVFEVALESNQYGLAQGTISAAVTPTDKVKTNRLLPVRENTSDYYEAQDLNTWITITNTSSSGVVNSSNGIVQLFNNQENTSENNISCTEIQSQVPTFSNTNAFSVAFSIANSNSAIIKTGYSYDSNLSYDNFAITDLLKTTSGMFLPQSNSYFSFQSLISWNGVNTFGINVYDVGAAQTCSITTSATDNLFFYSQSDSSGQLTPPVIVSSIENISTSSNFQTWIDNYGVSTASIISNLVTIKNQGNTPISISTGLGINTVAPGQPYVYKPISISSTAPSQFIVTPASSTVTSSVNFLYDFGGLGTITSLSLTIQIVEPPECPLALPSFKYSIEVSDDFINWTLVEDPSVSISFTPTTGNVALGFTFEQENSRFARVRFYYDPAVTFDPREKWRYSSFSGTYTADNTVTTNGKFVLGFTDQSAKNASLGQLYNQPTYLRKFVSNSSMITGIILDFSDWSSEGNVNGPVYLKVLTNTGEKTFYTIEQGFTIGSNNTYILNYVTDQSSVDDAFYIKPYMNLTGGGIQPISIFLDDIIPETTSTNQIYFGYYPFISLVGNGNINVLVSQITGEYNEDFNDNSKAYFSLFNSENVDYTATYGKNLLTQNTFGISSVNYPEVNSYFRINNTKVFSYDNITFTVRAVFTAPTGLYGETYTDGVYLKACDYVLITGQSDKTSNGVYQVQKRQWVKLSASSGNVEPTVLCSEGNVFGDTLWMQDIASSEWISNVISCPFVLSDNNLLFTGISSSYKYPQYLKLASYVDNTTNVSSLNQVRVKIANSPNRTLSDTDTVTQWNSLLQNGKLYELSTKSSANNTVFLNFGITTNQVSGITTSSFPAIYNLIVAYSGQYIPAVSKNSNFVLPKYGSEYRIFQNPSVIYQMFSTRESVQIGSLSTSIINTGLYGLTVAGLKTPQSSFSADSILDNTAPSVGILSKLADDVKNITLGLTTALDTGSGLSIARIVQKNPANETIYGSWFGFNTSSLTGVSTIVAYPSFVSGSLGVATGEPLSGYYQYSLQIADNVGNLVQTNSVESFYYESAIVDTIGPTAEVNFVSPNTYTPVSISTSTLVTAQMFATDAVSEVKAYRYRLLPDGEFGNWTDYNMYADIFLPENVEDGILSIQFQFKDFGNNVLYANTSVTGEKIYVYTWSIVSKLISNVLFTVTESTTFNDSPVLLIGASKQNVATLYVWNNSKLIELQYPGFIDSQAITAMLAVGDQVIIGTNDGQIFNYQNGVVTGPFEQFTWGDTPLPISKFELHQYESENSSFVYAATLNIPRIFRTASDDLKNTSWQVVQPNPISLESVEVLNTGLWSGTASYFSITPSFQTSVITPTLSYGISSVIVTNSGSNINTLPTITVNGALTGAGFDPILQGYVSQLNLLSPGTGYTAGATVTIQAPAPGGSSVQATGYAVTNANGQIVSIGLNAGGQGYGYTVLNPSVTISGNLGFGSQAVASALTQYDSIYKVGVTSAGFSTNTNITLTTTGGATLVPDFLYRITDLTISNPGYGYTSSPTLSVNGMSTIATAFAKYGSVQSVSVTGSATTFPLSQTPVISLQGGFSTAWNGGVTTTAVSFSTGTILNYSGFVLNAASVNSSGTGFGTVPKISFTTSSLTTSIFEPEIVYNLSDDLTLYTGNGSIYDIKSFAGSLFFSNSFKNLVELKLTNNVFTADAYDIPVSSNTFRKLTPQNLAIYNDGNGRILHFSTKEEPYVGTLKVSESENIFESYKDNILLFRPYNFDILSNWQLVKILNSNGIATATYGNSSNNTLLISNKNAQVFYESTNDNTWRDRCKTSTDYLVNLVFEPQLGTQSLEISTFTTVLKVTFTVSGTSLVISFGDRNYESISIDLLTLCNLSFVKTGNDLLIYNFDSFVYEATNFFATVSANPVIKFGYIFEPQVVRFNNQDQNVFGLPDQIAESSFVWHQIKFSFDINSRQFDQRNYDISLPYILPNSESVRVLKTIDSELYAVTKAITDSRSTTSLNDLSTKVYRMTSDTWNDVTGNFESYAIGINSSYILTSPNDINALGKSYFVTGLVKQIPSRDSIQSILLGITTNVAYEEQSSVNMVVIYPYNPYPAGVFLSATSSNPIISLPSNLYFSSEDTVKVVNLGIGSTSINTVATISVSDGVSTSSSSITILPIKLSQFSVSTSSFVGYSLNEVIATINLNAKPKTNRTVNFVSSNSSLLQTTGYGVATVLGGTTGLSTNLFIGSFITSPINITVSAEYRGVLGISTLTGNPFILTMGLSTSSFFGNGLYESVNLTASIQASPKTALPIRITSNFSSVLSDSSSITYNHNINSGEFSQTFPLVVGLAVTTPTSVSIGATIATGVAPSASIATTVAYPLFISNAQTSLIRPVFGLQTSQITFTLNTTPKNDVTIINFVSSPTISNFVFPSFSTVFAGTATTTFGVSTSRSYASGIAVTVKGGVFGFNTNSGVTTTLISDVWRITNFFVTPNSIVGAGGNATGIAQSFAYLVSLNVGVATTVVVTSSNSRVDIRNITFGTSGFASTSLIGFATGFSTTLTTGVAFTAFGPSGLSSTFSGLTLNPFLISSFSTGYIWNGLQTNFPNYTVGGVGGTVIGNVTLNAYALLGVQTVSFTTPDGLIFRPGFSSLGVSTIGINSNTTSIALGSYTTSFAISTVVTARLLSSSLGIATMGINIRPVPTFSAVVEPIFQGKSNFVQVSVAEQIPVSRGVAISVVGEQFVTINMPSGSLGVSTFLNITGFSTDRIFTTQISMLGITQTYYVQGYAKSGGVFGMGYNYYGELSAQYPVIGGIAGTSQKVYMGLPYVAKTASGSNHNLALDNNGVVYAIGYNAYYQLGNTGLSSSAFSQVGLPSTYKVRDIFAQNNSSYAITADNYLWGWGSNEANCLGTSTISIATSVPYLISTSVQMFSVYENRGTIITFNNSLGIQSVFEFGAGAAGVSSFAINALSVLGVARTINNLLIQNVDTGPSHTIAAGTWTDGLTGITSSGNFAWGSNAYYQTGSATSIGTSTIPNVLFGIGTQNTLEILSKETHIVADYNFSLVESNYRPNNRGIVTGVTMNTLGIGYTAGATVTFSAPQTSVAAITAQGIASTNNLGYVNSLTIINGGSGYNLGAGITFSPPPPGVNTSIATGIATVTGANITSVTITNPGFGYTQAPTVYVTGVSGGTGGIVTSAIIQGQVTGILITNPGYGYTSTPTITITSNNAVGTGATASAFVSFGSSVTTRFVQIGAADSSNSSGINYGIAATSIGVALAASGAEDVIKIYKIAKNKLHYAWVNENGTVIMSGGLLSIPSPIPLAVASDVKLYASHISGYQYSELSSSISLSNGLYVPKLYGTTFAGIASAPVSYTLSSPSFFGAYTVDDYGGFAAISDKSGLLTVLYVDTYTGNTQKWSIGHYPNLVYKPVVITILDSGRDSTLGPGEFGPTNRDKTVKIVYATTSGSGTTINVLAGVTASSYGTQTLNVNPVQYIVTRANATVCGNNRLNHYRGSIFEYYGTIYTWIKSEYNFVIGYQDGSVELYGDAYNTIAAVGGGINIISTWNPDGSAITAADSVIDWSFPNTVTLFVGTANGNVYAYAGDGDPLSTNIQVELSITQSPQLMGTLNIPSGYGYATGFQNYIGGMIIVSTSNNYILIVRISTMTIVSYLVVPGAIKSITATMIPENIVSTQIQNTMVISVTAEDPLAPPNSLGTYAYYIPATRNVEMGLGYANPAGSYQSLTLDGSVASTPYSTVFNASTSDTFTLILDSSKPTG